ncbi:MAG: hypothetical protein ABEJ83_04695 [Candidatus Nanohaloarchaea archaeon]
MTNRTERITFWCKPDLKERVKEVEQFSQAEIARLGTIHVLQKLERGEELSI